MSGAQSAGVGFTADASTPAAQVDAVLEQQSEQAPAESEQAPAESEQAPAEPEQEWPTEAERKGMRAHDEDGNIRPADGRWELHRPRDESRVTAPQEDTP